MRLAPPELELPGDGVLLRVAGEWRIYVRPNLSTRRLERVLAILAAEYWYAECVSRPPANVDRAVRRLARSLTSSGRKSAFVRRSDVTRLAG